MTGAWGQGPGQQGSGNRSPLGPRAGGGGGEASSPGAGSSAAVLPELSAGRRRAQGPAARRPGAASEPPAGRGLGSRPTRALWDWGPHPPDPRHVPTLAPAGSPPQAGTAALTSSRKPAVSRARNRFKPARPRRRRAPPAGASSRAALARAESAWAGSAGGRAARPAPRLGRVPSPGHAPHPGLAAPGHAPVPAHAPQPRGPRPTTRPRLSRANADLAFLA